ncbi:MAG: CARDB domain-containing protein [Patescibacteria group bacterium]
MQLIRHKLFFIIGGFILVSGLSVFISSASIRAESLIDPSDAKPIITNIQATEITSNSALITFSTDRAVPSRVGYGMSDTPDGRNFIAYNNAANTNHAITLSTLLPDTTYYYRVTAVGDNTGVNNTESVSYSFKTLKVSSDLPDFTIREIVVVKNATDGHSYAAVDIENIGGTADAKMLDVEVIDLDTNQNYRQSVGGGNFEHGWKYRLEMSSALVPKDSNRYRLQAIVDLFHTFVESDESNNSLTKTIEISDNNLHKPDLTVSGLSWSPTNPLVNQDVIMTITIKNVGQKTVTDRFWVTVAHNRDSEITSDIVSGYKEERDVVAGGIITRSFHTKFAGTGAFSYTILIPDTDKERVYENETYPPLHETDITNNSLSKTITVATGTIIPCTDSDGGANYHTKGVCTDALGVHEDTCVAVDASGRTNKCLTEYYCNKSTQRCDKAKGGEFECAFGCSENACIMKNEGITIPVAGEYYFKMNWYNAAENTTISLVSPIEKKIAQYYGYYPTLDAPASLGVFQKGDNLLLSLKSSWWNTFYGPVYSSDPLNFKVETVDPVHWRFTFEGPLRYDRNYNDGSFEIYRKTVQPVPVVTDTDGGKDYYQKGVCRSEMNNYKAEEDKCLGDTNLLEFFPSTYDDGRGICGSEVYACPHGCSEWACRIISADTKPDFIVQNITLVKNSTDDKYYASVKFRNIGGKAEAKTLTIETTDTATNQKYYANNGAGEILETGAVRELVAPEPMVANTTGVYNLMSNVDSNNVYDESDESNNTLAKTVIAERTVAVPFPFPSTEEEQLRERIKKLELRITELERQVVEAEKRLTQKINTALARRLKGRILLQVEENGEAWYVDPVTAQRFYLKDGESAYRALQAFGLGISDANLQKIPVGLEERADKVDSDDDGLDDRLEEAIGTDSSKSDTDGDGFNDSEEIKNVFNPVGAGRLALNTNLANRLNGRIVLQVENRGQAWYIHDGQRYYLKDGNLAYQIMRYLSDGITNNDLRQIGVGELE